MTVVNHQRLRRAVATIATCLALLAIAGVANAATEYKDIASAGPLTNIYVGKELSCQIDRDTGGQIYSPRGRPSDCGTFVAVDGTVYGANFRQHYETAAGSIAVPFEELSQSAVYGDGSWADPYRVLTRVQAGDHITVTQEDDYVVGNEYFTSIISVTNDSDTVKTLRLSRAWDCYLGGSDMGYGFENLVVPGSTGCSASPNNAGGGLVEGLIPFRGENARYFQSGYEFVWMMIGSGQELPNTCLCDERVDNGAAIQWELTLEPGETITRSVKQLFSPDGELPESADLSPGSETFGEVTPGATSEPATLTFSNNGGSAITLGVISVAGAGAGQFRITGGTCTAGASIPAAGSCTVVVVFAPTAVGDTAAEVEVAYTTASGKAEAATANVSGTGQPAGTHGLTVETFGSGNGKVISKPAGINCGKDCESNVESGTKVTLTADAANGSVFVGWTGACDDRALTCAVTMTRARTVRAEFNVAANPEVYKVTKIKPAKKVLAGPGARSVRATVTANGPGTGKVVVYRCIDAKCKRLSRIAGVGTKFVAGPNAVTVPTKALRAGRYRIVATMGDSSVTTSMRVRAGSAINDGGAEPVTG